jgi:hypothetical protein
MNDTLPRPESHDPALFDTAVKLLTSFRFAKAPNRVSVISLGVKKHRFHISLKGTSSTPGTPPNPNPVSIQYNDLLSRQPARTSAHKGISRFNIVDCFLGRIPQFLRLWNRQVQRETVLPDRRPCKLDPIGRFERSCCKHPVKTVEVGHETSVPFSPFAMYTVCIDQYS